MYISPRSNAKFKTLSFRFHPGAGENTLRRLAKFKTLSFRFHFIPCHFIRSPIRLRAISVILVPDLALADCARVVKIQNGGHKTLNRCEGSLCRLTDQLACVSQKTRKLLGPGNRPAKLPKRLSGVSQSTRKLLTPKNTSFFPVNFTGTHYLPKSVFGSVFLVLA